MNFNLSEIVHINQKSSSSIKMLFQSNPRISIHELFEGILSEVHFFYKNLRSVILNKNFISEHPVDLVAVWVLAMLTGLTMLSILAMLWCRSDSYDTFP